MADRLHCCGFALLLVLSTYCVVKGVDVGTLPTLAHGVSGTLEIVSPSQLRIRGFRYDGGGPAAFVYYYPPGVPVDPNRNTARGVTVRLPPPVGDSTGAFAFGRRHTGGDLTIDLPAGTDACDISTFTIWCEDVSVFFSTLEVPAALFAENRADPCRLASEVTMAPPPTAIILGTLPTLQHGVSGTLEIISNSQMRIRDFRYDGNGPGAFLYYYAPGVPVDPVRNTSQGIKIPIPSPAGDAEGAFVLGNAYTGQDFTFNLPVGTDVCDISTITIWCEDFDVFFTRLDIPRSTFVEDGADPCRVAGLVGPIVNPAGRNCIPLDSSLQLYWTVDQENSQVDFEICGCRSSSPSITQYMGFGISGSNSRTLMDGADVTIAWTDDSEGPMAVDYHLRSGNRVQCRSGLGVCPDTVDSRGTCSNNVLGVRGVTANRQQCVSFSRPFTTDDADCDLPIDPTNEQQYIVWGVGPLEETALRHTSRSGSGTAPIHLGRDPMNQCEGTAITCEGCPAFERARPLSGRTFQARIGPSGNDRGYMAITDQAGWGITWFINGALVPELYVIRGETYTFTVEGGNDPSDPSNYHPLYITDSISGGRLQNTPQQQADETVYAGFNEAGEETATGRLCMLTESDESISIRERCRSLQMYTDSLSTTCRAGSPGTLQWTPNADTPDTVYYQCATHRNLGWRINVVDDASEIPVEASSAPPVAALSLLTFAVMSLAALLLTQ